jgi:2-oxoglutarate ferredoxin oxidoreductase subunit beta
VDVLQVCVTFDNLYEYYDKRVYELKDHDSSNHQDAYLKIREWDYNSDGRIPLGVLYRKTAPVFDDKFNIRDKLYDRAGRIKDYLKANRM